MSQYSDEMEEVKRQFEKKVVRKGVNDADEDEDDETENFNNKYMNSGSRSRPKQRDESSYKFSQDQNEFDRELGSDNEENEDEHLDQDIQLIINVIYQEKYCPDIILYQQQIIDDLFELLQNQEQEIKDAEQSINDDKELQNPKNKFLQDLMKEECERVKYLIKLYTRTRIFKIQKYYMNIIKNSKYEYLNIQEKEFVNNYATLRKSIFNKHILSKLPQHFRNIGVESEDGQINSQTQKSSFEKIQIETPNLDKAVFAKFKTAGNYDIDGEQIKVEEGEIIMLPYRNIKSLHQNLDVELV